MNFKRLVFLATVVVASFGTTTALAQAEAPDLLVKRVSTDVLDSVKADPSIQAGDVNKIVALVNAKILPFFDFERMTASAMGAHWREASPAQQKSLQDEFKTLLVRVYSGALAKARDRTVELRPMRGTAADKEVVVRTEVRGQGDPVQLDFRLANGGSSWKIYDMNVGGVWLVENYRGSFAHEIDSIGIDGLIAKLSDKNKAAARN